MIRETLYRSYLGDGEKIHFVIHRHIFMQTKHFLQIFFFGIFLPAFGWWLFPQIKLFAIMWLIIGLVRFIYEFFDWYYDVWLVTNLSVIEVMWRGFFEKSSVRIEYHTIQAIGYEVKGLMRTVFNYGTIALEKFAGHSSVFDAAVKPKRKVELLMQAQEDFIKNKNFRDHSTLQGILTDLLQRHVADHGLPQEEEVSYRAGINKK